jgi:RNA polymerase sigma-70 factor, ECF subfamily
MKTNLSMAIEKYDKSPAANDDATLVKAARSGDKRSFGMLFDRYWNMAVALAYSRIGKISQAEDVAQDSFIKAYSYLLTLRDPERFGGWFSRIVVQNCVDYIRRNGKNNVLSLTQVPELQIQESSGREEHISLTHRQQHFVRLAVANLPDKLQQVVILRFISGMTITEIARQLGKNFVTVRVRLHRACRRLEKELKPLFKEVMEI